MMNMIFLVIKEVNTFSCKELQKGGWSRKSFEHLNSKQSTL